MKINIGLESFRQTTKIAFLQTGFRPFFLLASGYAVVAMTLWMGMYLFQWDFPMQVSSMLWHGHEMIYGYGLAVIAGFLLTAVRNWTKLQTADGYLLLSLVVFWLLGRTPPITRPLAYFQAFGDIMFGGLLFLVIATPILHRKMNRQWAVLVILFLLLMINVGYYLSTFGWLNFSPRTAIYIGLYLILNLIFVFARRLVPSFISSALRLRKPVRAIDFKDRIVIPLFILFSVNELFFQQQEVAIVLAAILLILHAERLIKWYDKGIWTRHLLWSLYVSYSFLTVAFLVRIGQYFFHYSPFLSLHTFTIGGIGMMTMSMMARVSFGHTGRSILEELQSIRWLFWGVIGVVVFRVALPLLMPMNYRLFVGIAMAIWIISFLGFWIQFFGILTRKREDGRYG